MDAGGGGGGIGRGGDAGEEPIGGGGLQASARPFLAFGALNLCNLLNFTSKLMNIPWWQVLTAILNSIRMHDVLILCH